MSTALTLKAGALLLGYPDPARRASVERALEDFPEIPGKAHMKRFLASVRSLRATELEALYVATFDFREECALYLTFQEHGDARDRAPALMELKQRLRACGFECPEEEMPDYLPLLLEFLAERPGECGDDDLVPRVGQALRRIAGNLPADVPYPPLLQAILEALPGQPGSDSGGKEAVAEEAPLPYPLRYL